MKTMIKRTVMGTAIALAAMGANAANIFIDLQPTTVVPGGSFTATVKGDFSAEPNGGFTSGSFELTWDPSILTLTDSRVAGETQTQLNLAPLGAFFFPNGTQVQETVIVGGGLDVQIQNCDLLFSGYCSAITDTSSDGFIDIYELDFTVDQTAAISLGLGGLRTGDIDKWLSQGTGGSGATPLNVEYFGAEITVNEVPLPAAVWLFGTGLLGLAGVARRRNQPEAAAA